MAAMAAPIAAPTFAKATPWAACRRINSVVISIKIWLNVGVKIFLKK